MWMKEEKKEHLTKANNEQSESMFTIKGVSKN